MVFQPAEEGLSGAREMLAGGLFDWVTPDVMLGFHNWPLLPAGTVGWHPDVAFASSDGFDVVITGKSGHGAHPHLAVDPVVAAAHFIGDIQMIVSREIAPVAAAFTREGLRLVGVKLLQLTPARAGEFYAVHREREFFGRLTAFMVSGPVIAMAWSGDNAVARARAVMGATDWRQALPGTIRAEFSRHETKNVVHGSDSAANAEREIAFFFDRAELAAVSGGGPES